MEMDNQRGLNSFTSHWTLVRVVNVEPESSYSSGLYSTLGLGLWSGPSTNQTEVGQALQDKIINEFSACPFSPCCSANEHGNILSKQQ